MLQHTTSAPRARPDKIPNRLSFDERHTMNLCVEYEFAYALCQRYGDFEIGYWEVDLNRRKSVFKHLPFKSAGGAIFTTLERGPLHYWRTDIGGWAVIRDQLPEPEDETRYDWTDTELMAIVHTLRRLNGRLEYWHELDWRDVLKRYDLNFKLRHYVTDKVYKGGRSSVIWKIAMTLGEHGATEAEIACVLKAAQCWQNKYAPNSARYEDGALSSLVFKVRGLTCD